MAVVEKQSKEIDGVSYSTVIFPATEGLGLIQWLTKVLGTPVLDLVLRLTDDEAEDLLAALVKGELENDVMKALFETLVGVATSAEPGEVAELFKATLARTEFVPAPGQAPAPIPLHFDAHFAGRYMHLVNVFVWVVRVSFVQP